MISPLESVPFREGIVGNSTSASGDAGEGNSFGDPFGGEEFSINDSETWRLHGRWVVMAVGEYRCGEAPSKPMMEGSLW